MTRNDKTNEDSGYDWDEGTNVGRSSQMRKRTLTTIRCVPRFGYDFASPRTIDFDLPHHFDENDLEGVMLEWFSARDLVDALFAVEFDDEGYFAIVNDEAFHVEWGEPLI